MTAEQWALKISTGWHSNAEIIQREGLKLTILDAIRDAVAQEREACATLAECAIEREPGSTDTGRMWRNNTAIDIARAIRARK